MSSLLWKVGTIRAVRPLARLAYNAFKRLRRVYFRWRITNAGDFEKYWTTQHLRYSGWEKESWESQEQPERQVLLRKLSNEKFDSLLEVGCASGPNLVLIHQLWPKADLFGIDINEAAIEYGRERFLECGAENVEMSVMSVYDLGQIPDKSYDIVLAWALFLQLPSDELRGVVGHCLRIARKKLLAKDVHNFAQIGKPLARVSNARRIQNHYARNWWGVLAELVPTESCTITEMAPAVNNAHKGQSNAFIEVCTQVAVSSKSI